MQSTRTMPARAAVWVLWLITVAVGLVEIYFVHEIAQVLYALSINSGRRVAFSDEYYTGVLISSVVTIVAAIVWVVWAVGSGEYLRRRANTRTAWKVLAVAGAAQVVMALVYFALI